LGHEKRGGADRPSIFVSPEVYQTAIEKLELSPRTLNCLKRAHLGKVGQVLELTNSELLKIRNFGEKSLEELLAKLLSKEMLSEEEWSLRAAAYENRRQVDGEADSIQLGDVNYDDVGPLQPQDQDIIEIDKDGDEGSILIQEYKEEDPSTLGKEED
jgi:hypothetical protein